MLTLATDHNLVEDDKAPGDLCCIDCLARVPRNSRCAADFPKSKCDRSLYDKPIAYVPLVVTIGSRLTHPTHTLKLYGGVFICINCGSVARSNLSNLGRPCFAPTTAGKNNLKAYGKGKAPLNCIGGPFTERKQHAFVFTEASLGKWTKAEVLAVANLQSQLKAVAAAERELKPKSNSSDQRTTLIFHHRPHPFKSRFTH